MKHEKYILLGSVCVLVVVIGYTFFSKAPVQTIKDTATTPFDAYSANRTPVATSTFNTKEWSAVYRNDTLGFSLTFPDSWRGYRTQEILNGVVFGVEDQNTVFSITVYTLKEWQQFEAVNAGKKLPTVLKKNESHIFVVSRADEFSQNVLPLISVYPSILTTFTLIK